LEVASLVTAFSSLFLSNPLNHDKSADNGAIFCYPSLIRRLTMSAPNNVEGPTQPQIFCKWCQEPFPNDHSGPCPKCGKIGRSITLEPQSLIIKTIIQKPQLIIKRRSEIVQDARIKWISRGVGLVVALSGVFVSVSFPYSLIVAGVLYVFTDYLSPFLLQKLFKPKH
jgi:hypothetical protein